MTLCLVLCTAGAFAQPTATLVQHSFDKSEEGWTGIGANCRASITTQSSFNGNVALKFEYDLRPKAMGLLMWPAPEGALTNASTFRFWVNADHATSLGFIVQERGGGRYIAMFSVPAGKWQKVEIARSDLVLSTGKDDPKDPNGQLDTDRIEAVGLGDLAQFVAQSGSPEMAALLGIELGPRTLLLDSFSVTTEKLPPSVVVGPKEVRLDTFARPQVAWMATCPVQIVRGEGNAQAALAATYRQAQRRLTALVRPVPAGTLKGMQKLAFSAESQVPALLLIQVEEAGGGKFNTTVEIPKGGSPQPITVNFENLNSADDSTVKDRGVKPDLISQVVLIDATGLIGAPAEADNTLVIRNLRALADTP